MVTVVFRRRSGTTIPDTRSAPTWSEILLGRPRVSERRATAASVCAQSTSRARRARTAHTRESRHCGAGGSEIGKSPLLAVGSFRRQSYSRKSNALHSFYAIENCALKATRRDQRILNRRDSGDDAISPRENKNMQVRVATRTRSGQPTEGDVPRPSPASPSECLFSVLRDDQSSAQNLQLNAQRRVPA